MSRTRSSFTTSLEDGVAILIDLDGEVSVTNDAENVVREVYDQTRCTRIIYRDTQNDWDELKFEVNSQGEAEFKTFSPVDAKLAEELNLHAR